MNTKFWLDYEVSWFKTIKSIEPNKTTMRTWVNHMINPTEPTVLQAVETIKKYRSSGDRALKGQLPAVCPSAILRTRSANVPMHEKTLEVTGLMQFDIDAKDNPHIADFACLRDQIFQNRSIALTALSTSGNGVWGLILTSDSNDYQSHFSQLIADFEWVFNIKLDPSKGANPTDLRFLSYDPDARIRERPEPYKRKVKKAIRKPRKVFNPTHGDNNDLIDKIDKVCQLGIDIAPDYDTYLKVGFALADELKEDGRNLFHRICEQHANYKFHKVETQYNRCLRSKGNGITIGTLHYILNTHLNK